jgi:hypothetical protein
MARCKLSQLSIFRPMAGCACITTVTIFDQSQARTGSVVITGELPRVFVPCGVSDIVLAADLGTLLVDLRRTSGMDGLMADHPLVDTTHLFGAAGSNGEHPLVDNAYVFGATGAVGGRPIGWLGLMAYLPNGG